MRVAATRSHGNQTIRWPFAPLDPVRALSHINRRAIGGHFAVCVRAISGRRSTGATCARMRNTRHAPKSTGDA